MKVSDHLDKNNLHHAYLIEGLREEIIPEILEYIESLGIKTLGNPDFCQISMDNFKIDEALNLRSMGTEKAFTDNKKIFVVSANNFSLDAQGVLLKMFEEPIENTHFFLIVPEADVLLRTLVSRFYLIKTKSNLDNLEKEVEKFISMPLSERIIFVKSLITDEEESTSPQPSPYQGEGELNSPRSKALKFLNVLESVLHQKVFNVEKDRPLQDWKGRSFSSTDFFDKIFTAREFIRQPGSSTKSLMEMVALIVPKL
ncbi:MAG: hypothetical protein WC662_00195 [Candidatus Paceibacterota bacterium]|jgi:hypothetical protein